MNQHEHLYFDGNQSRAVAGSPDEKDRIRQLEQQLQQARQQGSSSGEQTHSLSGNGAMQFNEEYAKLLEKVNPKMTELREALFSQENDTQLRSIVDDIKAYYDEYHRLKGYLAKILINQLGPLTEKQLMGITDLQRSFRQVEDVLTDNMKALHQSIAETLSTGAPSSGSYNMDQMAMARDKLGTVESFVEMVEHPRNT